MIEVEEKEALKTTDIEAVVEEDEVALVQKTPAALTSLTTTR